MLVFVDEGKPENPKENPWSKARTNNKLNPHDGTTPELKLPVHISGRQGLSPIGHNPAPPLPRPLLSFHITSWDSTL